MTPDFYIFRNNECFFIMTLITLSPQTPRKKLLLQDSEQIANPLLPLSDKINWKLSFLGFKMETVVYRDKQELVLILF